MPIDILRDRIDRARELSGYCGRNHLLGIESFDSCPVEQRAMIYNGIGPEWLPEAFLHIISDLYDVFAPAAFIHDLRYALNKDRSRDSFLAVNEEFRQNCLDICKIEYGWYNPLRYLRQRSAHRLANACDRWGWAAWNQAYRAK